MNYLSSGTWKELSDKTKWNLKSPRVDLTDEDVLRFAWSTDSIYAEIEIHEDGSREWFCRNRITSEYFGSSGPEKSELNIELIKMISIACSEMVGEE